MFSCFINSCGVGKTSNLRSHFESRFFLCLERDSDEHLPTIVSNSLNRRDQGAGPGRPRVRVTREQLQRQASLGAKFQELWEYPKEHCAEDVMNLEWGLPRCKNL